LGFGPLPRGTLPGIEKLVFYIRLVNQNVRVGNRVGHEIWMAPQGVGKRRREAWAGWRTPGSYVYVYLHMFVCMYICIRQCVCIHIVIYVTQAGGLSQYNLT